jgi:Fe-S-cluster containining protein
MEVPENCKGCGVCCKLPRYRNIPIIKTATGDPKFPFLEIHYGKCQYLNDNNECEINDTKPQGCKDLIKGSKGCLSFLKNV